MSSVLPLPAERATERPASTPALDSQAGYRPDIDGLRGVAVLSVLAVHSFPEWVKGGFIGVDIFFVLSGFLITGILLQSLDSGRFSYVEFYTRRVRRIFPALCLVLFSCLVFSAFWTFPAEARTIGKHIGAGAVFVSNVVLWQEAGYFDLGADAKPLLHLWSLGIEEQFYLVWPVAMVLLSKRPRWGLTLLCAALLASFACNLVFVAHKPSATFFLPPGRFWELMVGALLAWLTRHHQGGPVGWLSRRLPAAWTPRHVAGGFAGVGLSMLVAALCLIDKAAIFPGWWALLPTWGTFALLAAGPQTWINRHLLSQPVLRFYGAISYPLYLWHWPLLSFPVVLGMPLTNEVRVMILIASVALGALTFELIEKPIRLGSTGRRTPLVLCMMLGVVGLGGLLLKQTDGLLRIYPESMRGIASTEFRFDYSEYRVDKCMARLHQGPEIFAPDCVDRHDNARRLLLLWGDSHAAALYPGLARVVHEAESRYRLAQYTAAACPPLLSAPPSDNKNCTQTNRFILERIAAERPDTVVLGGNWALYGTDARAVTAHMESLRETVMHLRSLGVPRIVVFGNVPTWTIPQPSVLMREWRKTGTVPERTFAYVRPASLNYDKVIERALAGTGAVFVSPVGLLCNATGCQVSGKDGDVFYAVSNDDSHLTAQGSAILIERSRTALFH